MQTKYALKGLTCPNCAAKIENNISKKENIHSARINLMSGNILIEHAFSLEDELFELVKKEVLAVEDGVEVLRESGYIHTPVKESHNKKAVEIFSEKNIIIVSTLIFAICLILKYAFKLNGNFTSLKEGAFLIFLISGYILIAAPILLKALKNIAKGQIFDENFLMSIATVGAFFINEPVEAVAVMLFYRIGEFFQDKAVERSRHSIESLINICPEKANLKVGNDIKLINAESIKKGDILVVKPGDIIPADGTVVKGKGSIDTKVLTGEALPQSIEEGSAVFSGCINLNTLIEIRAEKSPSLSAAAKIKHLTEEAAERKTKAENFITKFAKVYTPTVVVLALLIALMPPLLTGGSFPLWLERSFIFLIISCPCALVISIPLSFFTAVGAFSKQGILVKGSNYIEALHKTTEIVFDKTGTLTEGKFKVVDIKPTGTLSKEDVLHYCALCEYSSTHPLALSITEYYGKDIDKSLIKASENHAGMGVSADIEGKKVLVGNKTFMEKTGIEVSTEDRDALSVYVAIDNRLEGIIQLKDNIKQGSFPAMESLKKEGIKTHILTGDKEENAKTVSQTLNIDSFYHSLLPEDKLNIFEDIKAKNTRGLTAFVGDGINDAPVLRMADIGIAMGALGSDSAIEAADIVLMKDDISKIPLAKKIARKTHTIVMENIVFSIGVKILFLIMGALGLAGMWAAVFADVGVTLIAIANSFRVSSATKEHLY
ncbi:MAG: cadmium-translocating P-type ATPase [Firmicutes bacterium]|nr:cadmium-translocating P-type ATPase [Bacillota bacterium]